MLNEIIKMIELSKNTKGQDWRHNIKQIKIKINEYAKEYHESEVKKLNLPDVSDTVCPNRFCKGGFEYSGNTPIKKCQQCGWQTGR